jgi:O-antigen/teichoic acid export membrane protein
MFKNLSWSLVSTLSNILFQFVGVFILSKILTPADYGIIGIIAFFTNIADMLVDSGMGGALIYKKDPTDVDFSTLFIFNLLVSLLLYALLCLFASPLAVFYNIEELGVYIKAYGLIIVIIALCITQDSKLKKKMDFRSLALISICSNIVSLSVAVYGAYIGWGIWALIAQALIFQIVRTIGLYIVCGFNKNYRFSKTSFIEQFSFGGWLLLSNVIHSVCSNIYSNIIPKIGTLAQNGYYTQSVKIGGVPTNTINLSVSAVAFPYLAQSENDDDLVKRTRALFRKIYHVSFPMLSLFSVISYEIIQIILGEQWLEASFFLKIILLSGVFDIITFMLRTFQKACGKTRLITRLETIKSIIKLSIIGVSTLLGIKFLIYSILLSSMINAVLSMIVVHRNTSYKFPMLISDTITPLFISCAVVIPSYALVRLFGHSFWNLLIVTLFYLFYFLLALLLKNRDIKDLKDLLVLKIANRHAKN